MLNTKLILKNYWSLGTFLFTFKLARMRLYSVIDTHHSDPHLITGDIEKVKKWFRDTLFLHMSPNYIPTSDDYRQLFNGFKVVVNKLDVAIDFEYEVTEELEYDNLFEPDEHPDEVAEEHSKVANILPRYDDDDE